MTSEELNRRFYYVPLSFIVISFGIHLCVPVFFAGLTTLDKKGLGLLGKRKEFKREIYQEFVQVDVVALPDELISEMKAVDSSIKAAQKASAPPPKEEKVEPTQEEADVMAELKAKEEAAKRKAADEKKRVEAEKKKQAEAEAKKKKEAEKKERDAAMKRLEAEAERKKAMEELTRTQLKGNIKSKGTATQGQIGAAKDAYGALLQQKIKQNFNIFPWQEKKDLVALVYLEILPDGKVKERSIIQTSADSLFDSAVLQAIDASQPLPVPGDVSILEGGFKIEFRPKD